MRRNQGAGVVVLLVGMMGMVGPGRSQTAIDLRTQSKNVDFGGAAWTRPFKMGAALPGSCVVGEAYFLTTAAAGQNFYGCVAANVWAVQGAAAAPAGVASVFGRMGAVGAQAGDYSFAQISGAVAPGQLGAGIDAGKIGAGTVDNARFGYLAGVTGDIQAQLNGKAAAGHGHMAGGDVAGDLSGVTVVRLRNREVSETAPAGGQALVWNAGLQKWEPQTLAAGGPAGAAMGAQLGDFGVVRSSGTELTVGAGCTAATPCNVRFGNTVYRVTAGATATLSGGTGMAYIFFSSNGNLTVGHNNLTVACSSGCSTQSGVTAFPADSVPMFTWTAAGGAWDAGGGTDWRGWLATVVITAGAGIATVNAGGATTVGVDTATVPTYLSASAPLTFAAIPAGSCSADQSMPLAGALVGDAVAAGWPGGLAAGLTGMMRVSATGTVAVRLCNFSGSSVTPGTASFRATVVRSF